MKHPFYIKTPIIESSALSHRMGKPVYLKIEMVQPSGSFKNRGLGLHCYRLWQKNFRQFVAASGGNAGLAVAYSGRKLGCKVTVIIPVTTPEFMKDKIRLEQADVIIHGKDLDEASDFARNYAKETQAAYISPFDHPDIWEGNSTIVKEIFDSGIKPGIILLTVGGGGLLTGVLQGLKAVGWEDVPVMALETEGAASYSASIKEGHVVALSEIKTIATSLGLKRVTEEAIRLSSEHTVIPRIYSDKDTLIACQKFLDDEQYLVEPACGLAFAPLYQNDPILKEYSSILIICCGGRVINLALLEKWVKDYAVNQ